MSQNTMHDQSSSTNSPLLPSNIQNMPISNRRSSSRINPREVSGARRQSGVRRGISKTNVSSSYGRSSKATPQSRRENKKIDIDLDIQTAMDYDVNNVNNSSSPQRDEDEQQNLLNISSASADTTIAATLNHKNRLLTRPIEYFIHANDGEKVKCSLCLHNTRQFIEQKLAPLKEQNINMVNSPIAICIVIIGFKHGLYDYLFPSQIKQRAHHETKSTISSHLK
ncbi:unnamed protein product [Rotaria socialis]|uniref:Uncharacterized protein n=1 Tax=Rotaria socialis TaxID=392032 RepID=A0A821TK22_9BILA|nr:unnamed protein product [Rotaria socialis]